MEEKHPSHQFVIAEVIGKMCGGGVEAFVFGYLREFLRQNLTSARFDIYYSTDSTQEPPKDLIRAGVRFLPYTTRTHPYRQYCQLRDAFTRYAYDIVHVHLNSLSGPAIDAAKDAGVRVRIIHSHTTTKGDRPLRTILKNILARFARRNATTYAACSREAAKALYTDSQVHNGLVTIIPNATDFATLQNPLSPAEQPALFDAPKNAPHTLAFIGRLEHQKNPGFAIRIFAKLVLKDPSWRLVIIGDGSLRSKLEAQIRELRLEDKVSFIGTLASVSPYYSTFTAVLIPSLFEGLPFVAIEAQIAGVPVICSTAIPDEAHISTGIRQLSLSQPSQSWVNAILEQSKLKSQLLPQAYSFDIARTAPHFWNWYQQLIINHENN